MSKVVYEVTLSPDGKPSVSVRSDDPLVLQDVLPLAKQLQERLLRSEEAELSPGTPQQLRIQAADPKPEGAPVCEVHATPMVRVNGRRGPFWSCHKMNLDGSWCSFRPGRSQVASTPPAYSFPAG